MLSCFWISACSSCSLTFILFCSPISFKINPVLILFLAFSSSFLYAESRFGDLTEMRDERMRGKDGKWVRPHPGPFIWNGIEKEQGVFSWEEADKYVSYAQDHNQKTLATIWPHANWEQKLCKRKK